MPIEPREKLYDHLNRCRKKHLQKIQHFIMIKAFNKVNLKDIL